MYNVKKIPLLLTLLFLNVYAFAQQAGSATGEPVDFMNSNGKIYVVMAVVITIILGLFIYLINLERKISKLEQKPKG